MEIENIDTTTDDVRAAVAQLQNPDVARDVKPEPETPTDLHAEPDAGDGRARDERGRFTKAPEQAAAEQANQDSPPKAAKEADPAGPQAPAAKAPPSWLAAAKADWDKLPPAVQQAVVKREDEVSRGFAQKAEEARRWSELEGIIAPRRSYYQRFGFQNDVQAINHLLTFSDSMERDPIGTIAHLAQHYGVSLDGTGAQPQLRPQPQPQQHQPADIRAAIQEEIGLSNARSQIEQFAANSAYPHFQAVRGLMSNLLMNGHATSLEEAYDAAVWASPQLRGERQAAEKAKDEEAQRAKLEAKKRASNASLNGAPHGAAPGKKTDKSPSNPHDDAVADVRAAIAQLS